MAYVKIPDLKRVQLASRAYECAFIGYAVNSKAYMFYDLNDKMIIDLNNVEIYEDKFPSKLKKMRALNRITFM